MAKKINLRALELRFRRLEKENKLLKLELDERKLMVETLHDNEQQLYALVTCVPGAVYRFRIDSDWTLEFMSDEISTITGYPASTFMFNSVRSYRSIIHPDDREQVENKIRKGINKIEPFTVEYRIVDANDRLHWCSEKGRAVFSADGEPLWLDGTIFDITGRRVAENELLRANEELVRIASIDSLTHIANRRHFTETLEVEWKRMTREQRMLSLILCDIDFFKLYNDNHGHQEGDKCLVAVAKALGSVINRPGDLVARFGGEEFIAILPDTDSRGANYIAERMQSELLKLKIVHEHSTASQYVTLSLGVASTIPNPYCTVDDLIKAADDALYEAKNKGRNQICVNTSLL